MGTYELGDGDGYVARPALPGEPLAWPDDFSPEEWRDILLQCLTEEGAECEGAPGADAAVAFAGKMEEGAQAAFSDSLNT